MVHEVEQIDKMKMMIGLYGKALLSSCFTYNEPYKLLELDEKLLTKLKGL